MSKSGIAENGAPIVWHRLPSSHTSEDNPDLGDIEPSPSSDPILQTADQDTDSTDEGGNELVCGIGACRPWWLQWVAGGPKAFTAWCTAYIACKVAANLYIGGVINVIEKQFKLSSSESGAIMILNDAVELSLVMFVSYFGHKGHRPRIIAVSAIIAGLGLVTCALPHLTIPPYTAVIEGCNITDPVVDFCTAEETDDPCSREDSQLQQQNQPRVKPVVWLIIGQILLGIGNVAMKPLSTTYIDDTVGKHTTPVYIAVLAFAISLGAMGGFSLASLCLSFYVDFDRVAPEHIPQIPSTDPRYVGAWWLGFAALGCMMLLLSIPFFFFPRHLPKTKERIRGDKELELKAEEVNAMRMVSFTQEDDTSEKDVTENEVEARGTSISSFLLIIKKMLLSYKTMLTNAGLIMLCLSSAAVAAVSAGNASFGAKYFKEQFEISDSSSAVLSTIMIPFLMAGNIVGAVIIRRYKLSPTKCVLFVILGESVGIILTPAFLTLGCQTKTIAGISTNYVPPLSVDVFVPEVSSIGLPGSLQQALSSCNMNCTCWSLDYNPVCGSDGLTYVSPCYAGCEVVESAENENTKKRKTFSNCRCIGSFNGTDATAVDGPCSRHCANWKLPAIVIAIFMQLFSSSLGFSALILITLRIVDEDLRATAIGFQSLVLNLIGYFPAPVYFGYVINKACILWGYDANERGACWVYNRDSYRHTIQGMFAALRIVEVIFLLGVYWILRRKKKDPLPAKQGDVEAKS